MITKAEKILNASLLPDSSDIVPRIFSFARLLKANGGSISATSIGNALEKLVRLSTPFELAKAIHEATSQYDKAMRDLKEARENMAKQLRTEIEKEVRDEYTAISDRYEELKEFFDENENLVDWYKDQPIEIMDALESSRASSWNYTQVQNVVEAMESTGRGEW